MQAVNGKCILGALLLWEGIMARPLRIELAGGAGLWGQVFHLLTRDGLWEALGSGLSFAHERSVDACGVFLKRRGLSESSVATTSSAASEGIPRARPLPRRSSSARALGSGLSFAHEWSPNACAFSATVVIRRGCLGIPYAGGGTRFARTVIACGRNAPRIPGYGGGAGRPPVRALGSGLSFAHPASFCFVFPSRCVHVPRMRAGCS